MASYEMQGLTWQALKKNQQDAVLIAGRVIQHKGIYSKPFLFDAHASWCAAVADGISSHSHSGMAAHQVLETVQRYYAQHEQDIKFAYIQDELCRALDHAGLNDPEDAEGSLSCAETYGAGTACSGGSARPYPHPVLRGQPRLCILQPVAEMAVLNFG